MSKKIDKFLDEAVTNIREDREITRELLEDPIKWLAKDEARHKEIGFTLSKYVETLQRSNEQLVKIATLLAKNQKTTSLSDDEMADIYDMIKEEK